MARPKNGLYLILVRVVNGVGLNFVRCSLLFTLILNLVVTNYNYSISKFRLFHEVINRLNLSDIVEIMLISVKDLMNSLYCIIFFILQLFTACNYLQGSILNLEISISSLGLL